MIGFLFCGPFGSYFELFQSNFSIFSTDLINVVFASAYSFPSFHSFSDREYFNLWYFFLVTSFDLNSFLNAICLLNHRLSCFTKWIWAILFLLSSKMKNLLLGISISYSLMCLYPKFLIGSIYLSNSLELTPIKISIIGFESRFFTEVLPICSIITSLSTIMFCISFFIVSKSKGHSSL